MQPITRRQKKNKKKRNVSQNNSEKQPFNHPAQILNYGIQHRKKMRFLVNAAITAQVITYKNLIDTICVVTAATSVFTLFRAVKINNIEMWDTSALGSASSLGLLWNENDSNLSGTQKMITDISMGVIPAHLKSKPSRHELSSEWHIGAGPNNTQAFALWSSASCVIDVDLSFKSGTTGTTDGAFNACVGGNVGAVAFRGLDGLATAATKFICPIGVYQL
jgi:hypothetical protein